MGEAGRPTAKPPARPTTLPGPAQHNAHGKKSKVVTITSGKGGVGKTTTTANLGVALARLGKKVVLIDADIGLRNLDVVMGLENRIVYDLVDIIEGRCKLRQALIKHKAFPDLYLIPAAQTRDKTAVTPADMVQLTDQLREEFDFILIDCPAGIERGFRNAIAPADMVLIVTNPEVSAVRDADRIIGLIEAENKGPGQLILNRVKADMVRRGEMLSPDDVVDILAIKIIGIVPEDENVIPASNSGVPVSLNENSRAGAAFRNIARRLNGEEVPITPLDGGGNILQRFVRFLVGSDSQ
ncbi:MAG: septum site-determining protein MinD [Chloroflexi bacterium]|nr:septum site-determining protein MinD [Chloroflexota bacterium]